MKIKSIQFKNHKVLGNLFLDFTDSDGKIVDTVLIAGQNGTGKSTILNEIYKICTYNVDSEMVVKCDIEGIEYELSYFLKEINGNESINIEYNGKQQYQYPGSSSLKSDLGFSVIFSDVDINFNSNPIHSVTSLELDSFKESRKSDSNITQQIKQLIIDIQDTDDADLAKKIRDLKGKNININDEITTGKMERFINAFNFMFDDLRYEGVENKLNHKEIIFRRGEEKISLDNLSSGEKQIIYRGSFILKDLNALKGAVVLIDEPEISMHPEWQKKIMDFYKRIFQDSSNIQTSQIIAVTHSPFIIHNDLRKDDKVIVLSRNNEGKVEMLDKPEYYFCNSTAVIKDAFKHEWFEPNDNIVYLEGRTDERYFCKAIEVFKMNNLPWKFKWIGHIDEKGQEEFTGKDSLCKAYLFSLGNINQNKQVFLFDCDTRKQEVINNNSIIRVLEKRSNGRFRVGIENALVIDELSDWNFDEFYNYKEKTDDYGGKKTIPEFKKMEFCDKICKLDDETLKKVFANLEKEIKKLKKLFN